MSITKTYTASQAAFGMPASPRTQAAWVCVLPEFTGEVSVHVSDRKGVRIFTTDGDGTRPGIHVWSPPI